MAEVEYICINCWEGFTVDDAEGIETQIDCPHCGAQQTGADLNASEDTQPSTEEDVAPVFSAVPEEADDSPEDNDAEDDDDDDDDEEEGEDAGEQEEIEPLKAVWRLKNEIGLTYNFVGVEAVLNWAAGKKGIEGMQVTIEGSRLWKEFDDFRRLVRKYPPLEAFNKSAGDALPEEEEEESATSTAEATNGKAGAEEDDATIGTEKDLPKIEIVDPKEDDESEGTKPEKKRTRFSDPIPNSVSTKKRRSITSPSIRTTGEFTFRLADSPPKPQKSSMLVLLGFLLGAGSVISLWLFGVLPPSPFGG